MRSLSKPETFELFKKLDILCIGAGAIFTAVHFPVAIEACAALVMALPGGYPGGLKFTKALSYFLENYDGLTLFLEHADVAIDNNLQERLLRSHVDGRKTWYGTHSERGAETAAIIFSIIETCKLNQVNPREYLEKLAQDLLQGQNPYTSNDFADLTKN